MVDHIPTQCVYARETWHKCLAALNIQIAAPTTNDCLEEWWSTARQPLPKTLRKGFDSVVILISWSLWKQRNARMFHNGEQQHSVICLVSKIIDELWDWNVAGMVSLDSITIRVIFLCGVSCNADRFSCKLSLLPSIKIWYAICVLSRKKHYNSD